MTEATQPLLAESLSKGSARHLETRPLLGGTPYCDECCGPCQKPVCSDCGDEHAPGDCSPLRCVHREDGFCDDCRTILMGTP